MRLVIAALLFLSSACAETIRCPDGQVFDAAGNCVPIEDVVDAGPDAS